MHVVRKSSEPDTLTTHLVSLRSAYQARRLAGGAGVAVADDQHLEDHLLHLGQALSLKSREVFIDYVGWAKIILVRHGAPESRLASELEDLAVILREQLDRPVAELAEGYVTAALKALPSLSSDLPSFFHSDAKHAALAHQYFEAVRRGDRSLASRLILNAVDTGVPVKEIYLHVFQTTQYEIGRLWQLNQISVAQEHYCTAVTQLVMSQLYPYIFSAKRNGRTLVAASVSGNLHEIGIRMVSDFFEMEGWNTFYLGANTPHAGIVEALIQRNADVVAISATISYHVEFVRTLIASIRANPACRRVRILVGGYPFSRDPELWRQLGADGFTADATSAVALANQLVGVQAA